MPMENSTIGTVLSNNHDALLSFTLSATVSVLPCHTQPFKEQRLPPLDKFIATLLKRSELLPCVCVVSFIYLQRLKSHLPSHARGEFDTPYRLFLASVLTASKFMSEAGTALTSQDLAAMIDNIYTPKEINLMERCFLRLIKYRLFVNPDELKNYISMHGALLDMCIVDDVLDHRSF